MQDVAGRTAFITGGGGGVGLGMAHAFLSAGMRGVVIADVHEGRLETAIAELSAEHGERAHAICLDVTDRAALAAAADETERRFGAIHVVCNNAGVNLFNDMAEATYQDWDWIMGVNLGGVINGVVTFAPRIKAHGEGGHIVNTASMASFISGPGAGIYTAAKFGVRGLSEALRFSLHPHGIGVSVYCPGLLDSNIHLSDELRPAALSTDMRPADPEFMARLPEVQRQGMDPREAGEKVLRGILRGDFYIFSHPEFKDELREIFDEALAALPQEDAPANRLAFEDFRRAGKAAARSSWPAEVGS
ncbi:MAG TPA: SDR family NAD(P)-dependent oxidoreductase [Solirubrobacteraceae bacterium]|nr:SDR family NAD(P)-dependent oxidoreductase [Solirubrobacteraceae bacterium]